MAADLVRIRNACEGMQAGISPSAVYKKAFVVDAALLNEVIRSRTSPAGKGRPVLGIPGTNPCTEKRAISLMDTRTGQIVSVGDAHHRFSQQSMSKPTAMALAIQLMGGRPERYGRYIGMQASALPYNDATLAPDGRPFNSSVNIGALATWMLIQIHTPQGRDPFEGFLSMMKSLTGNSGLTVNEAMAIGEFDFCPPDQTTSRNRQLLATLDASGFVDDDSLTIYAVRKYGNTLVNANSTRDGRLTPEFARSCRRALSEDAFLSYCRACAVMVNTEDMANVAAVFRSGGVQVDVENGTRRQILPASIANYVRCSSDISGSYEESGTQFRKNAFGGKTGVDGGIFGSLYRHANLVVATHHADLNPAGNSGEGQKWIGTLNKLNLVMPSKRRATSGMARGLMRARLMAEQLPSYALGPSPREMDAMLQAEMTAQTRRALTDAMPVVDGERRDFYAKTPSIRKAKGVAVDGTQVLLAPDIHGRMKRYYHMAQDRHALEKIVVVDETSRSGNAARDED
ncbi:Glutaminase 1 [Pandoraea aquatica]|uniref:glutaminase n=1 Tax=Pandoraea aquatica TaxID=2508290 RepID=A0A5E4Y476_9BURK|nr:glutaminase [Pandoraea aquatica]VVE43317.1 Glutaminase 1 [Pandoraea aquatica]